MAINVILIAYIGALASLFCALILAIQALRKQPSDQTAFRETTDSRPASRRDGFHPTQRGTVILAPTSRPSGRSQSALKLVALSERRS
jgi:hypothetical protein